MCSKTKIIVKSKEQCQMERVATFLENFSHKIRCKNFNQNNIEMERMRLNIFKRT